MNAVQRKRRAAAISFDQQERTAIRVFLLLIRAECERALERFKRTISRTNGEVGTSDLRYWSHAVKLCDYAYHRAGRRVKADQLALAVAEFQRRGVLPTDTRG